MVPRPMLLLVFDQGFETEKDRRGQKKSNLSGQVPCFWRQTWFKGFPNGFQNVADIPKKAIQKMIEKWIPICIASGSEFYICLMTNKAKRSKELYPLLHNLETAESTKATKTEKCLMSLKVRVFDCSTEKVSKRNQTRGRKKTRMVG